ncbi:hypothetical protein Rsub_12177 [Raphidocelis subcapitata]|uniref:Uncharacterized protein n=1 Tax=Raphidocelis subcapitata TaxID=307507 RepID=A0A2V0PMQ6_9CHLO|nr:hypothetical protein Rsub_12177 [Raphidocelis subcapitata]|eukprot:GBF99373.1 hypothetical protein Rsub_12177 [Raphidocelis subcapitata]
MGKGVKLPEGPVGVAIRVLAGIVVAFWWTNAPGAEEASEARMKQEKRTPYSRHYALKGRGRKEQLHFETKGDRCELVPTRASLGV